ncbi:hypothetical protein CCR75_004760 [Bremia lactucae]|uniref:Secreted RxLR effector n=1 Tax=Bremia lactucae TaxID=4779 RepID=A0A976FK22_BRELC|nr:hypothetical protein CCR75_004760 [Bremia lactucae]
MARVLIPALAILLAQANSVPTSVAFELILANGQPEAAAKQNNVSPPRSLRSKSQAPVEERGIEAFDASKTIVMSDVSPIVLLMDEYFGKTLDRDAFLLHENALKRIQLHISDIKQLHQIASTYSHLVERYGVSDVVHALYSAVLKCDEKVPQTITDLVMQQREAWHLLPGGDEKILELLHMGLDGAKAFANGKVWAFMDYVAWKNLEKIFYTEKQLFRRLLTEFGGEKKLTTSLLEATSATFDKSVGRTEFIRRSATIRKVKKPLMIKWLEDELTLDQVWTQKEIVQSEDGNLSFGTLAMFRAYLIAYLNGRTFPKMSAASFGSVYVEKALQNSFIRGYESSKSSHTPAFEMLDMIWRAREASSSEFYEMLQKMDILSVGERFINLKERLDFIKDGSKRSIYQVLRDHHSNKELALLLDQALRAEDQTISLIKVGDKEMKTDHQAGKRVLQEIEQMQFKTWIEIKKFKDVDVYHNVFKTTPKEASDLVKGIVKRFSTYKKRKSLKSGIRHCYNR